MATSGTAVLSALPSGAEVTMLTMEGAPNLLIGVADVNIGGGGWNSKVLTEPLANQCGGKKEHKRYHIMNMKI